MTDKGHNLKKIVSTLQGNRRNVQNGTQVPENINSSRGHFNELQQVIKGQTTTIGTLKSFEKAMHSENTRNLENKKFFLAFVDRFKTEMNKFMKITESVFKSPNYKVNATQAHKKNVSEIDKVISNLRQSDSSQKIYSSIFKLLGMRQNILCQFLRVMLYKKNVLWRDLNIRYDDYVHGEIKNALNKIKESEQKFGFVPSTLQFKVPKAEVALESHLPDLIEIAMHDYDQMIESVQNFSKLSSDPQVIDDISKNQNVVKGLREKIQSLTMNYNILMQKYRSLQISKGKNQIGAGEQKTLNEKIQDLEVVVMKKEQDIIQLKQALMKNDAVVQGLKEKNKQLEQQMSKWQNFQLPKIKELQLHQRTLFEQFSKTRKDFDVYSGLYQNEREEKLKAYSQLNLQKQRIEELASILGRERRKIKQLKAQIQRKQQIIIQIVEDAPEIQQ